jgi:hypothetical protein
MKRILQLMAQASIYGGFAFLLAYFSNQPSYERIPPDSALIKLSFAHSAGRAGDCRKRTYKELMELAPNMRAPLDCPRGRLDVQVRMKMDGKLIYSETLQPTGIHGDNASITYQRLVVPSGTHALELTLVDSERTEGYDYISRRDVTLSPGQSLAIDFHSAIGGEGFTYE